MNKPIIERDVVLIGKTEEGNDTFDLPVTRLANIENDAEVKEKPDTNDFFPVIDMSDNGKMKKTSSGGILAPLTEHTGDGSRHVTPEEKSRWNEKASGNHNHDDRYYTKDETDNKLAGKSDHGHTHSASDIGGLPSALPADGGNADTVDGKHASDFAAASHDHPAATRSVNGFMSAADKTKLDGIAEGANAYTYTHPIYTARIGVPAANQTPAFGGTFSVSQPVSDGTGHITGMNTRTVKMPDNAASPSKPGLMSAEDKTKLDGLTGISAASVSLGSSPMIPEFMVPTGAKYVLLAFDQTPPNSSLGHFYYFMGLHFVGSTAEINTGSVGSYSLLTVEDGATNSSSGQYITLKFESGKMKIYGESSSKISRGLGTGLDIYAVFF